MERKLGLLLNKYQNLSLQWKINLIGIFIILLFSLIVYFFILPDFEKEKLDERKGKLKAVVNSVVSLMDHYERTLRLNFYGKNNSVRYQKSDPYDPASMDEAKKLILKIVSEMRYDKTEYFFILDGDGNMILHPMKPELIGKNMLDVVDNSGRQLFKEMVRNSQRDGETFVSYIWQSKYSPIIYEPQTTYARYYWPWDWVVCSGLYTQDITDSMRALLLRSVLYDAGAAAITILALFLIIYFSLSRPLARLLSGIREIHNGNLDYRIRESSKDEIGYMSKEFNIMVNDLKESRDSIIRSERKYRDLTDMLPDIVYETDTDLNITHLNNAGLSITGYSRDDVAAGLPMANLIDADDLSILFDIIKNKSENPNYKLFRMHKIHKKDGGIIHGENSAVLVLDDQGRFTGLRGSIRDVTEKLKLEETLMQTQKMETIGTLAGGIAHDFNNILGGITGALSIMKYSVNNDKTMDADELKTFIEMMEESSQRAADLVQQLLTLAHKHEAAMLPVDLALTVKHIIRICNNSFDKSVEIITSLCDDRIMVSADPTQMEQILLNLCVNAYHAMTIMRPAGEPIGGKLTLSIHRIYADDHFCKDHPEAKEIPYWILAVSDTGVGIDEKNMAKIFVPFFTSKDKDKGTGLGLSMVYNIVHQHNGFIDVYSEPGTGSTFNVYLPVFTSDSPSAPGSSIIEIPKGEGLILVVDDEEMMRTTARSMLEKCGYQVITASNGAEAVEIYREQYKNIKAVLIDLIMPKKSGEKAYIEMKEIHGEIKALMASGFRQDERVETALRHGINGFIQKPYTLERLACAMSDLIGKK